ncbi:recombinase [Coprobacillus sp. AF21-8LB]|nr:recombinase [Coprobacillus sp. AF21-8LB]
MAVQSMVQQATKNPVAPGIKNFNNLINSSIMRTKIHQMVGATDSQEFITSITSAVNTNPALAECDPQTIISAALLGQSLHLKPSPQLGYFYMVPYKNKRKKCTEAQFQIGYKGYLQMAIRTNEYVDIDATVIRQGEYKGRNKLTGKPEFEFIEDDGVAENLPVVGYMAYFEMKNGYIKRIYWSKEKMEKHADTYSAAFNLKTFHLLQEGKIPQEDLWKYSSFWYKNFDEMAKKTMLRQLLSKHALLSTELAKAIESDQAVIDENLNPHFEDENVIDANAVEKEAQQQIEATTAPTMESIIKEEKQTEAVPVDDFDPMSM